MVTVLKKAKVKNNLKKHIYIYNYYYILLTIIIYIYNYY